MRMARMVFSVTASNTPCGTIEIFFELLGKAF
jgi:hypothetical protein